MLKIVGYSLIFTIVLIVILRPLAIKLSFVDSPGERKLHSGNIPLIGGSAIYLCLVSAIIIFIPVTSDICDLLIALSLCFFIGVLDDKFDINPKAKFIFQLAIALFLAYKSGVQLHYFGNLAGFGDLYLGVFSGLVAVFSMIVGMNAFNMLDGIDGLSAGLAVICITAMLLVTNNLQIGIIGLTVVCSLLIFLVFNMGALGNKNKIFLGDNGSMLVGLLIAWILIVGSQDATPDFKPVTAIWLIAIPLIDMTSVMFKRARRGESMLKADREHLHHKLIDSGFSTTKTLVIICFVSVIGIIIGFALDYSNAPEYVAFYLFLMVLFLYNLLQTKLFKQSVTE